MNILVFGYIFRPKPWKHKLCLAYFLKDLLVMAVHVTNIRLDLSSKRALLLSCVRGISNPLFLFCYVRLIQVHLLYYYCSLSYEAHKRLKPLGSKPLFRVARVFYPHPLIIKMNKAGARLSIKQNRVSYILLVYLPLLVWVVAGIVPASLVFIVWCIGFISQFYIIQFVCALLTKAFYELSQIISMHGTETDTERDQNDDDEDDNDNDDEDKDEEDQKIGKEDLFVTERDLGRGIVRRRLPVKACVNYSFYNTQMKLVIIVLAYQIGSLALNGFSLMEIMKFNFSFKQLYPNSIVPNTIFDSLFNHGNEHTVGAYLLSLFLFVL